MHRLVNAYNVYVDDNQHSQYFRKEEDAIKAKEEYQSSYTGNVFIMPVVLLEIAVGGRISDTIAYVISSTTPVKIKG